MNLYLLYKSFHLISLISWMAGLLYLPRIFVYHSKNTHNQNISEVFKVMERKLFNYIMMPAMILSWLFGLLLLFTLGFSIITELWIQLKLFFVFLLTFYHFYLGKCMSLFLVDLNIRSTKFYRIINEVSTILLILIVFIVVFKPI
jgi:putative membrane protein